MKKQLIPPFAAARLCALYEVLLDLERQGRENVSSGDLGLVLNLPAYIIRKDISCIGGIGRTRRGYPVLALRERIGRDLGLGTRRKVCIVGLGRLGGALIHYPFLPEFEIVAGFDKSLNRIELLGTEIDLFPLGRLPEIVRVRGIEIGVVAVPGPAAQEVADLLVGAGVKGILNFAPVRVRVPDGVAVEHYDLLHALRMIAVRMGGGAGLEKTFATRD